MINPDEGEFRDVETELRRQAYLDSLTRGEDCLDELQVAGFVDRALSEDERRRAIHHLAGCARCRSLVQATASMVADESVTREAPTTPKRWRRVAAVGAVAAAIVTLAVLNVKKPLDDSRLRELTIATTIAPTAVAPRGAIARAENLVWTSVPGAYRYHVRVQLADGTPVWSDQTADTLLRIPTSAHLQPGVRYLWSVEAQTEWQRGVWSEPTPFTIGASRP